jgi:spermidine/putrescine transport system substrate-binding protein
MIKCRFLLLLYGLCATLAWASPKVVNIYNWSGYLPEAVLQQFTQETGIRVNSSSYDSNEALYTKLKAAPHHGYDVIVPSSYAVHRMIKGGMLQPLDKVQLPNIQYLDPQWLNKSYDPDNQYSVPYLFSASGLVVNTRYHDPKIVEDWDALWQPCFKHKLLLLDDVRELFSVALLSLQCSPNSQNPSEIREAYDKLHQLLPNVRVFNSEGTMDLYATEELTVGMGWSGDIYRANQLNDDIQFVYPQGGYILSIDSLAIPKGAKHIEEAYQLINFLLRPDIAAAISLATGYSTVNAGARQHLPAAMLSNATLYPDLDTLQRSIVQLSAGEQTQLYEQYWERLKIEG